MQLPGSADALEEQSRLCCHRRHQIPIPFRLVETFAHHLPAVHRQTRSFAIALILCPPEQRLLLRLPQLLVLPDYLV
jgi:hypothetical protein